MSDLYRQQILEHYQHPEHWGELVQPDRTSEVDNPTCGDRLRVQVQLDQHNRILDIAFSGQGCAISIASASMLSNLLIGKTLAEAKAFAPADLLAELGIDPGPTRLKCALLSLSAVKQL